MRQKVASNRRQRQRRQRQRELKRREARAAEGLPDDDPPHKAPDSPLRRVCFSRCCPTMRSFCAPRPPPAHYLVLSNKICLRDT